MAESKLITAIGEELECPVCAEYFTDARFLSCMHTFCKTCLEKCDKTYGRGGKSSMNCPLCRKQTSMGRNGVVGLQIDFTSNKLVTRLKEGIEERRKAAGSSQNGSLNCQSCQEGIITAYCLSCCHFICASCQSLHTKLGAMRTHEVVPMKELRKGSVTLNRTPKRHFCSDHTMDAEHYCFTCLKYLCWICYLLDHDGHECTEVLTNTMKDAVQRVVGKLSEKMFSLTEQKTKVKRLRASVKRHFGIVKDKLRNNHDLRLRTVTRVMKEKHDELVKELNDDEEVILVKIASVDETLGHAESRAIEARAIGNNAVNDGEHAEIAFIDGYLQNVISSLDEDNSAEKSLKQIERFAEGVILKPNVADNVESLASLGHIYRPDVWDEIATCALPSESAPIRSIQFDSRSDCFLLASTNAVYSIDLNHVDGTMKHIGEFTQEHTIRDMIVALDGSSYYVLCEDNRIRVYEKPTLDVYSAVTETPPDKSEMTMSCIAVNDKGIIVVGDQTTETVVGCTTKPFKKMTDISPIQMAFTSSGDLAVVCRRICSVSDPDTWNQAGVDVRVFGVEERWENVLEQNNWQAAAVTNKHGNKTVPGRFFALGIYMTDDGRQLASLAEYDNFGIKKESIFVDIHLPVDLNSGVKPLIAVDHDGLTLAVFTGLEVHLFQKNKFRVS